jgi:cation/acetate symporter
VPDFVGDRYDSSTARLVAVVCALFVSFTYVAGQMRGVGIVFSRFLEVDVTVGVVLGMALVFFYAVLGGMKGITYTQIAQYCVLIFAYLVPAIFISLLLTGHVVPQIGMGATVADGSYLLDKLNALNTELGFAAYTDGSKGMLDVFCITLALMAGTAGLPHVIVRFFTVPRVRDARRSAGWALVFIALLYTTAPAVGSFARYNMIETINGPDGQGTPHADAPAWIANWEKTGLIAWTDKDGDGRMRYSARADNELRIDNDIMVLANPEIARLPAWVIALVAAGGLAAALSTAAGLLLVISSAISHDLLKRTLMPGITERQELLYARIAAAVAVLLAGLLGIYPPGFVAQVVAFAFGLAAASFFPAIVLGIFDKRTNSAGAVTGMLLGLSFTMAYIVWFKFVDPDPAKWWFGVSAEGIGVMGMLINFATTAIISRLTAPPAAHIQQLVEDIRVPRTLGPG